MDPGLNAHGWDILFGCTFNSQLVKLEEIAEKQKARLPKSQYVTHPSVKRLAAIVNLFSDVVPANPRRSEFLLKNELKNYCRVKGHGLGSRSRLFYRLFELEGKKIIVFLWLGFPRKSGDKKDCYTAFKKIVDRDAAPNSADGVRLEIGRQFPPITLE
ncbi:MAG: type II toxin-antitoxin system YhaV family toxin [Cyanobacteria bacterium]|nr:type II toxin-antitoxin system YhaV family toxin [Cyanobacteriota bacterium]